MVNEGTVVLILFPVVVVFSCCLDRFMGRSAARFWSPAPVASTEETELATGTAQRKKKKSCRDTTEEEVNNLPKILYFAKTLIDDEQRKNESDSKLANSTGVDDCEASVPTATTVSTLTTSSETDIENGKNTASSYHADECCICLEKFEINESLTSLPRCEHIFHPACVGSWILERKKNVCPICKTPIFVDPPTTCVPATTTTTDANGTDGTTGNTITTINKDDDEESALPQPV